MAAEFRIGTISVQIRTAFLAVLLLMIAMNMILQFCLLFIAVTLHELSHVFTAKAFGLKANKIIITPMGQAAQIDNLNNAPPIKRFAVLLAGPAGNLLISGIITCYIAASGNVAGGNVEFFLRANLLAAAWNIMPALPLDGGRIVHMIISRKAGVGVVPAYKICRRISRFWAVFLIIAGAVHVVLYPYDITLVLAAFYLYKISENEQSCALLEYYSALFSGNIGDKYKRRTAIKHYSVPHYISVKAALELISFDFVNFYYVFKNGEFQTITEVKLIEHVSVNGLNGCLGDTVAEDKIAVARQ